MEVSGTLGAVSSVCYDIFPAFLDSRDFTIPVLGSTADSGTRGSVAAAPQRKTSAGPRFC